MSDVSGEGINETYNEPVHWFTSLQGESDKVTKQKMKLAKKLGVPAVLFTPKQVNGALKKMGQQELARYEDQTYHNILYVLLLQGGAYVSQSMFRRIGKKVPNYIIQQDSYAVEFEKVLGRPKMRVTKPLTEGTRLTDKHIVLLDSAVRSGRVASTVLRQFKDPQWTVNHGVGGPASEVGLRSLTAREESDLSLFNPENIEIGVITPSQLRTAGSGSTDFKGAYRWTEGIILAAQQPRSAKDKVAETLELLGPRAVMTVDQIVWVD